MKKNGKKLVSLLLCAVMVLSLVPLAFSSVSAAPEYERVVDAQKLDGWQNVFDLNNLSTVNAGGVWTDKSVFTDASQFPSSVTMNDSDRDFLVSLSLMAANKEITGYSYIPTDTIIVLDASSSMGTGTAASTSIDDMVVGANNAIKSLIGLNNHNRVGVIVYSGSAEVLLPLDRYESTNAQGDFLTYSRTGNTNRINIASGVTDGNGQAVAADYASQASGTYTQNGIYLAGQELLNAEPAIESGQIQGGTNRIPIMVLMSDGAPSYSHNTNYAAATQNGRNSDLSENDKNTFRTMLTAAYTKSMVTAHYENEMLFYTLGYNLGSSSRAQNLLDPANMNDTFRNYTNTYLARSKGDTITFGSGRSSFTVTRMSDSSEVSDLNYVTSYFAASGEQALQGAFQSIVDRIILQSRYYATHIETNNPELGGYVTFTDKIGEYMEVKDIKGILLHNTLFDGHMFASKLNSSSSDGLGSITNPSDLGNAFISAVMKRLGITDMQEAIDLIDKAFDAGQLKPYDSATGEYSNYIGWYADANDRFLGFYNEGTTVAPENAVYKNKSYGLLGETTGSIKNSDMMYMSIQVHTNIQTGNSALIWKVPAALIPMLTYEVEFDGTSIPEATNVRLNVSDSTVQPVRLLYEVGLKDEINELSATSILSQKHVQADGTRVFWSNWFDMSTDTTPDMSDHSKHYGTLVEFVPSTQNERFYYTENTPVLTAQSLDSKITDANATIDENGTYYHERYIFTENGVEEYYELISKESLQKAVYDTVTGMWIIPMGTVYRYYDEYHVEKSPNATDSLGYYAYPFVVTEDDVVEVDIKLGNNGKLTLVPATGIKISKLVDDAVVGASNNFQFKVTLKNADGSAVNGTFDTVLCDLDEVLGENGTLTFTNGEATVTVPVGKTLYITGLTDGMTYAVTETDNDDYKVKTVHVNGQAVVEAIGTVREYNLEDVDFLNTARVSGNLLITKNVTHPFGTSYQVPDTHVFTVKVALANTRSDLVSNKTFTIVKNNGLSSITTDANGQFTIELKKDETVTIRDIPEDTTYSVTETNLPSGFSLDTASSQALTGVIDSKVNAHATLVNDYEPQAVSPEDNQVVIEIIKELTGRAWKDTDTFYFEIFEMVPEASRIRYDRLEEIAITNQDISKNSGYAELFDLTDEVYTEIGTYNYYITEEKGPSDKGISYDVNPRRFSVTVTDTDMDGYLEISNVENVLRTTVTEDPVDVYKVSMTFDNSYAPTGSVSVEIPIKKLIGTSGNPFVSSGFEFALYSVNDTTFSEPIIESSATDSSGNTKVNISFSALDFIDGLASYEYVLKELNTGINGMEYAETTYNVIITLYDTTEGTIGATCEIKDSSNQSVTTPEFVNVYSPTETQVIISGIKKLDGRDMAAGEFTFSLYEVLNTTFDPENDTFLQDTSNLAGGAFSFDRIVYTAPGTYRYAVIERHTYPILHGVTFDNTVYYVDVVVEDVGGNLEVTSLTGNENIVFTNTYKAKETSVTIEGIKNLTGGKALNDGDFEFIITDEDRNEVSVFNDGHKISHTFSFTDAGVYKYTIHEKNGGATVGGVTYDGSVYDITITVIDDKLGQLHAAAEITQNGTDAAIIFNNSYAADPIELEISLFKSIVGREMKAGEFKFSLTEANNVLSELSNTVDGAMGEKLTFRTEKIFTAGTYHYHVTEVNTELGGMNYDETVYGVTIVVEDDFTTGKLKEVSRTIYKNGEEIINGTDNDIVFNNVYDPLDATVTLEGKKLLNRAIETTDVFEFELYQLISGTPEHKETVANNGGVFKFSDLTFDEEGTFTYIVKEKKGSDALITYDTTEYTVEITVEDVDGTYVATVLVNGAEDTELVFTNVYTAPTPTPVITPTPTVAPTATPTAAPTTTPTAAPTPTPFADEAKPTGDNNTIFIWASLAFVLATVALATGRKKED